MQVDDIFRIGLKHIKSGFPCEDYSLSGFIEELKHHFVVISDGCSGSNGMTDIGARLWCLSFLNTIKKSSPEELFLDEDFVLRMLNYFNEKSFLNSRYDETASLIMLLANPKTAQFMIFGDGGYCIEKNDGTIILNEFSWYKNRPYYPVFKLEDELRGNSLYIDKFKEKDRPLMKKETKIFELKKSGITGKSYNLTDEYIRGFNFYDVEYGYMEIFDKEEDDINSISVFSDGLWSIQDTNLNKIVKELMIFKDEKRKNNFGFLKKKIVPVFEGWSGRSEYPLDDFSMGTLLW